MSVVLSFKDVAYPGFFEQFSCELQAGCTALIVTARETESTLLARLITGLSYPSRGALVFDGHEIAKLGTEQLIAFRQQTGIVSSQGGLISNLKAWENITLPLLYHSGVVTPEDEQRALNYLDLLGYSGNVMALPAHLSLREKRCFALVRAWMMCPRIIVYCDCFEGVSLHQLPLFSQLASEFHATRADRISLFISSSAQAAATLHPDTVVYVHETIESV